MKFFCEYCGNRIDAEKNDKCPHCGASYKKNKKFIKLEEEKNKEKEIHNEYKKKIFDHTLNTIKFSRWFLIIPIIVFILIITVMIFSFANVRKNVNSISNNFDSIFDSQKQEEKEVTVGFDEYGATTEYKVKVTKYEVVEPTFNNVEEGYEYVKFYLMVENLTDERLTKEDVNCIVDGVAQTNDFVSGYSDLPMFISKGLTVTGTSTFLVPIDATSYDIRYGDYITIHIEK